MQAQNEAVARALLEATHAALVKIDPGCNNGAADSGLDLTAYAEDLAYTLMFPDVESDAPWPAWADEITRRIDEQVNRLIDYCMNREAARRAAAATRRARAAA